MYNNVDIIIHSRLFKEHVYYTQVDKLLAEFNITLTQNNR